MRKRLQAGVLTVAILVVAQDTVMAGSIYRWTDSSGRLHYSDIPSSEANTVVHVIDGHSRRPTPEQGPGLRHGEIRMLERRSQQQDRKRVERLQQRRTEFARKSELQRHCQRLRNDMRTTRDHSRRKHYAGELRRHCW